MKRLHVGRIAIAALISSAALADSITLSPNTIYGTIQFANTNPDVLAILQSQGIDLTQASVSSTSPAGFSAATGYSATTVPTGGSYSLQTESSGGDGSVTYTGSATAWVYRGGPQHIATDGNGQFYFPTQSVVLTPATCDAPCVPDPNGVQMNFSTTVTVHRIEFGTDDSCATPLQIDSGDIGTSWGFSYLGQGTVFYYFQPNDGPGAADYSTEVSATIGSDPYSDSITAEIPITFSAAGDTIVDHCLVMPASSALGEIDTPVSVAGHVIDAPQGDTSAQVEAWGPDGNQRYGIINTTSSGSSVSLGNMVTGDWTFTDVLYLDHGSAQSAMYTNENSGEPVSDATPYTVNAGDPTDGSETLNNVVEQPFVYFPGEIDGDIYLFDPYIAAHPGAASTLSTLAFATDFINGNINGDAYRGPTGGSDLESRSNGGGFVSTSFAGRYDSAAGDLISTFAMPIELAYNQTESWPTPTLNLDFSTIESYFGGDWINGYYFGTPEQAGDPTIFRFGELPFQNAPYPNYDISPGSSVSVPFHYCFNEVVVQMVADSGEFVTPQITVNGGYDGVDFENNQVGYRINNGFFMGSPYVAQYNDLSVFQSARASSGTVAMTLPQGDWTLSPSVTFVDDSGNLSSGNFVGTTLNGLGCGQRVTLVPGFTVSLDQPSCVPPAQSGNGETFDATLTGEINSAGAPADHAWYNLNSGADVDICGGSTSIECGSTFAIPVTLTFGSNSISVSATSGFVSGTAEISDTIQCNADGCGQSCTTTCTPVSYYPADSSYGAVSFEDNWPNEGDFDFNDQTIGYNYIYILDASSRIIGLQATFGVVAIGATLSNGLYLHLPVAAGESGSAQMAIGSQPASPIFPLSALGDNPALSDSIYQIAANTRSLFGSNATGFINTDPSKAPRISSPVTLTIRFGAPIDPGSLDLSHNPFDLFIARTGGESHQVHLAKFSGAETGADASLMRTGDDGSNASYLNKDGADNTGRYYVTANGIPFGLDLPVLGDWPTERTRIEALFPHIVDFGLSAGSSDADFFETVNEDTLQSWQHAIEALSLTPPSLSAPASLSSTSAFSDLTFCQ